MGLFGSSSYTDEIIVCLCGPLVNLISGIVPGFIIRHIHRPYARAARRLHNNQRHRDARLRSSYSVVLGLRLKGRLHIQPITANQARNKRRYKEYIRLIPARFGYRRRSRLGIHLWSFTPSHLLLRREATPIKYFDFCRKSYIFVVCMRTRTTTHVRAHYERVRFV